MEIVDQEAPPVQIRRTSSTDKKLALDLFSGTGSAAKVLRAHGYHVVTIDCDPKWEPTHVVNVLEWDYKAKYPAGTFDVVVAAPPCTEYSRALTTRPRDLEKADALVRKALEIVEFYRPRIWWLETPATGLLAKSELLAKFPYVDCDQCQFSDFGYQKPTRFFGSDHLRSLASVRCDQRTCPSLVEDITGSGKVRKHKNSQGGNNGFVNKELAYRLPPRLVEYVTVLGSTLQKNVSPPESQVPKSVPEVTTTVNGKATLMKKKSRPRKKRWRQESYAVQKMLWRK